MIYRSLFTLAKDMCMKCTHIFGLPKKPAKFPEKLHFKGEFSSRKYRKFRKRMRKRRNLTPIQEESISEYVGRSDLIPTSNVNISASRHLLRESLHKRWTRPHRLASRTKQLGRLSSTYPSDLLKYFLFGIHEDAKRKRPKRTSSAQI